MVAAAKQDSPAVAAADPFSPHSPWADKKWMVYRGKAYDITDFISKHPGGSQLATLAHARCATALIESYHMRNEIVEARIKKLPVLEGFPVDAVPRSPYPNDSEVYVTLRQRVRKELFKGGEARWAHKKGGDFQVACALGTALAALMAYLAAPGALTGVMLGLAFAWIGTGVQHMGNHGALSGRPLVNVLLGLTSDIIGGSSLVWRYHHQVSHHIQTNDENLDEDVKSMHPLIRYDKRLPRYPHHYYQHLFILPSLFLMVIAWQYGDICALLYRKTVASSLYGATRLELASIAVGKAVHYGLIIAAPLALAPLAQALAGITTFYCALGLVLGCMFLVSHNVPEISKAKAGMPADLDERDWGVQQIVNSANWGDRIGCFLTGGLNLQIEHHLFAAVSPVHYPAISRIVQDECQKRGIPYHAYPHLWAIVPAFLKFMKEVGAADQEPASNTAAMVVRL